MLVVTIFLQTRFCSSQAEEAEAETKQMLGIYEELATQIAAIPVVAGRKSRIESFAGANCTYTIEAMMGDKRALQVWMQRLSGMIYQAFQQS